MNKLVKEIGGCRRGEQDLAPPMSVGFAGADAIITGPSAPTRAPLDGGQSCAHTPQLRPTVPHRRRADYRNRNSGRESRSSEKTSVLKRRVSRPRETKKEPRVLRPLGSSSYTQTTLSSSTANTSSVVSSSRFFAAKLSMTSSVLSCSFFRFSMFFSIIAFVPQSEKRLSKKMSRARWVEEMVSRSLSKTKSKSRSSRAKV